MPPEPQDAPACGSAPQAEPAGFDQLVEAVGPDACLVAIGRMIGPELRAWCSAEDLWQETLALAWRDREQHRFEGVRAYRAWLLAIARNRARDLARRAAAQKRGDGRVGLFPDQEGTGDRTLSAWLPPDSRTPSRVAQHAERARLMREALDTLPDELEPVLRLHLFEERTMESVAEELELHLSAAWRRYRKAAALYATALETLRTRASEGGAGA